MKKWGFIVLALLLTTACTTNNDNESGQDQPTKTSVKKTNRQSEQQYSLEDIVALPVKDIGFNIQKTGNDHTVDPSQIIPPEPDMEREELVIRLVKESEKHLGKKMSALEYVQMVYGNLGYKDVVIDKVPKQNYTSKNLFAKVQPGDLLYYDLDQDGTVDHYAIKHGNGDIIHANGTVKITDILKEKKWTQNIVYIQRIF